MKMSSDIVYWVCFARIDKVGAITFKKLLNFFDSMEAAWKASYHELVRAGITDGTAHSIVATRKEIDPEYEIKLLEKYGIHPICITDDRYPSLLKEIYNPPGVLFVRGAIEQLNARYPLAVVGSRLISPYGCQILKDIIPELAPYGTIISGLALGTDARAHEETIKAGGATIAVLGSGIDNSSITPRANYRLAQSILENNGTIISEYPAGTSSQPFHYPVRNRIISGLSKAVLVVEAAKRSGALITAYTALEQGRDVLAIPGSLYNSLSQGTNALLNQGARVITCAEDIARLFGITESSQTPQMKPLPASEAEEQILNLSFSVPRHIDDIIAETGLDTQTAGSTLTIMEIQGKIRHLGGRTYTAI